MKSIYVLLTGLTLWTLPALAQQEITERAVLEAHGAFDQALIKKDSAALASLTAEKLTYGHSSGILQDKKEFLDDVLHGPFRFVSITNEDRQVVLSGNTAVVRFILAADATNAGSPAPVRIGVMMVFEANASGKVQLLARQAYKL